MCVEEKIEWNGYDLNESIPSGMGFMLVACRDVPLCVFLQGDGSSGYQFILYILYLDRLMMMVYTTIKF